MDWPAIILSLPVALVGGWYLVNASSVRSLAEGEGRRANVIRIRLRRTNGVNMLLCGFLLYFVVSRTHQLADGVLDRPGLLLPFGLIALVPLVMLMLVLVWLDLRLTKRLRHGGGAAACLSLGLLLSGCSEASVPDDSPAATTPAEPNVDTDPNVRAEPEPQDLPTAPLVLGDTTFTLMIADDDDERERGLMFRREMAENEGMIFVFDDERQRRFWMKNTFLGLDLIFVDRDGVVTNIEQARPLDRNASPTSDGEILYVIEILRGRSDAVGLEPGDQLDLSDVLAIANVQ
jgi:uncharacterized membrane protein (UPF0127 family)